jgi:1-acyl-sn-glycerol-3-phosphate acyltransferase
VKDFIPPKHNALAIAFAKSILPWLRRKFHLELWASENCLRSMQQLKNQQAVLVFNHSDRYDPLIVASFAKLAGEDFSYLASREQFHGWLGFKSWLMQRCGVYSVIRGNPEDVESKHATIKLIAEGKHKLVEFPEGDVTGRDDAVLPLKRDGLQNMFEAQKMLIDSGQNKPVYLLPCAIFYEVSSDAVPAIESCIVKMESHFKLSPLKNALIHERLKRIVLSLIQQLEQTYKVHTVGEALDERLLDLCKQVTISFGQLNGVTFDESAPPMVLLHTVRGQIWRRTTHGVEFGTKYGARLREQLLPRQNACVPELDRLEQLLILAHTLQQKNVSLDLAWRLVDRLEPEILGTSSPKGHRIARLESGPIINLMDYINEYERSPRNAFDQIDARVRVSLLSVLRQLKHNPPVESVCA